MFGRSGSVRLFTVAGIRVGVDASWFLILFVMIYLFSGPFRATLDSSDTVAYVTTVVTVLILFASIIVHELGHAFAARRLGIGVTGIDLYMFGGLTAMDREPDTPGQDFLISIAGPLATALVIVVFIAIDFVLVGGHRLTGAIYLHPDVRITPVLLALSWLIPTNLLLLAFNLLPAFPLDGGRIVRSGVWRLSGSRGRGTLVAARLGQVLALCLAAFGVYLLADRANFSGLYTVALAWILFSSARASIARAALDDRLDGVVVADIMDTQPVAMPAALSAAEALDTYFQRYRWSWFPVTEADGRLTGIVREAPVSAAVSAGEGWVRAGSLVDEASTVWRIGLHEPLTELLGSESLRQLGAVMAVDTDGVLRGVVTVEQLRRALGAGLPA